jgi:hypothetical protein
VEPAEHQVATFVRIFFKDANPPLQRLHELPLIEPFFDHVPHGMESHPIVALGDVSLDACDGIRTIITKGHGTGS